MPSVSGIVHMCDLLLLWGYYSFSKILFMRSQRWLHRSHRCCKRCRGDERESSFSTPLHSLSFQLTKGTEEYTGVLELLLSKTCPRVSKTPHLGNHPFRTNLGKAGDQSQECSHSASEEEWGKRSPIQSSAAGARGKCDLGGKE